VTPVRLVTLVCIAQVCAQIGAYTWPALLPGFIADWHITNGQAGWITGLFYAAYTVSVLFLVTLTDRIDPRSVYPAGVGLTVTSHAGFAALADGPWSAGAARVLAGVGWAGSYMTDLKLLAKGATLAVHSMAGYAGGFVGPLMLGWILDLSGGMSTAGWGLAFLHVAFVVLIGQVGFTLLRPRDLTGDRPLSASPTAPHRSG